jgi:elongation factor G
MAIRMMEHAAARQRDRMIIVNRIDAPGVDLPGVLAQIRDAFGKECLPLNLPDAGGSKVVDCFHNREGHSDFGSVDAGASGARRAGRRGRRRFRRPLPERRRHRRLRAARAARAGAARGSSDPGLLRLGEDGAGVAELLDIIVKLLPHPGEANPPAFLRGEGDRPSRWRRCPSRAATSSRTSSR